jgi:hypothetical protein
MRFGGFRRKESGAATPLRALTTEISICSSIGHDRHSPNRPSVPRTVVNNETPAASSEVHRDCHRDCSQGRASPVLRICRLGVTHRGPKASRGDPRRPRTYQRSLCTLDSAASSVRFQEVHLLRLLFFLLDLLSFPRAPTGPLIVSMALRAGTAAGPAVAMDLAGVGVASEGSCFSSASP